MNAAARPPAWDMVETLTKARLAVPPLGATDPGQITTFEEWHWGTRDLDAFDELYMFDVEAVGKNVIDHGPLFALSHGGHGINSWALSLLSTAPSGDAVFFTQHGFGGAYSDGDQDVARINDAYQRVAREWAELDDGNPVERVRWLVYSSEMRGQSGIIDLDRVRRLGAGEEAETAVDHDGLFDELKLRRAQVPTAQTAPQLSALTGPLAEALRRLEDDSHLVIGVHGSNRYVQFATFRPNLRLETIGPRYLEEESDPLTVDQLVWLADHGWHDADDGGNLWREWIPADEDEAAIAAIEVLIEIHRAPRLDQVWFQSEDDNALAALEGDTPPAQPKPQGLQPTSPLRKARINAALNRAPLRLPPESKVVAVVDYIASDAALEVLALIGEDVVRRHDGDWRDDPEWRHVLTKAPARSIVSLTQPRLDAVVAQVDRSTAGDPWQPFEASGLEQYWPRHRPFDPDLCDWSQIHSLDDLDEA